MELQKLLTLILGQHQSSTVTGIIVTLLMNYLGSDSLSPRDMLILSMALLFIARFLGEGMFARSSNAPPSNDYLAPRHWDRHQGGFPASPSVPPPRSSDGVEYVPLKTKLPFILLGLLCLSQAACDAELRTVLLWSDRVVGYTDTARTLVLDFYCEDCPEHKISKEDSLMSLRTLQGIYNANGEIYRTMRAGMNAEQTVVTLDSKARARIESQIPLLKDKVTYYDRTLPPDAVKRLQPTTKLLTNSVNQFVGALIRAPTNDKGAVVISLTPEQRVQFNQQYARFQKAGDDLEAAIR